MGPITVTGVLAVIIIIGFFIYGYKAGFLKSVFDLLSFFLTGLLTWLLYPVVASWLMKTSLYEKIQKIIVTTLQDNVSLNESLPEFLIKLPAVMKDSIMNSSKQAFNSLVESTAEAMTVLTINIISVIILFVVVRVITFLVRKYSSKINKLFLVGKINSLLGGLFGIIQGIFVIYLIIMIISFFPTSKIYDRVASDLEISYVGKIIYKNDSTFFGIKARYPKKLSTSPISDDKKGTEND